MPTHSPIFEFDDTKTTRNDFQIPEEFSKLIPLYCHEEQGREKDAADSESMKYYLPDHVHRKHSQKDANLAREPKREEWLPAGAPGGECNWNHRCEEE